MLEDLPNFGFKKLHSKTDTIAGLYYNACTLAQIRFVECNHYIYSAGPTENVVFR